MDRMPRTAAAARVYIDFQPVSRWLREEGADTIIVDLPGFTEEQVRTTLDQSGNLNISGERPLGASRWGRFRKVFPTPINCNTKAIRTNFELGKLKVIIPKIITGSYQQAESKPKPVTEAPTTEKPESMLNSQKDRDESKPKPIPQASTSKTPRKGLDEKTITGADKQAESKPKPKPMTEAPTTEKPESMLNSQKDRDESKPKLIPQAPTSKTPRKGLGEKTITGADQEDESKPEPTPEVQKAILEAPTNEKPESMSNSQKGQDGKTLITDVDQEDKSMPKLAPDKMKGATAETYKEPTGIGRLIMSLTEQHPKKFIINMAVASLVVIGLGVYVAYKIRSSVKNKN